MNNKYTNKLTENEKQNISLSIRNISIEKALIDFNKLQKIGANSHTLSSRCRTGNSVVDCFTFTERLNTMGKYNCNYFDFIENIDEFKNKKFIQTMLTFYDNVKNKNKTKTKYVILKEVYNICISAINIFRPLIAMDIYNKYKPTTILDFTCGWGGRLVGACALNIPNYIGIDINTNLEPSYNKMIDFVNKQSTTNIQMYFEDAALFDYSKLNYDMVLTSPPYYFIEKYSNNNTYNNSKTIMTDTFYIPLISNSFKYLKTGGHYCLNVNKDIYENICVTILGNADETISLKKSKRQNNYTEFIYIWIKK